MSEMAKTIAFVAAAAGSLLLAFVVRSNVDQFDVESLVGERLNEFDVDEAKRLKIVKFDNETAKTREFEIAADEGLWTIPSKQGYPADAARQMAEAATCLIDREVLRVAAKDASQHQELGVVDPSSPDLDSKAEGVGIRVTMTDINDGILTDMIIGKPVKDAEGQYYVRKIDQDAVFVVSLNPEKLSTNFNDWIEDDLLKLNPSDIRTVHIKDYSAEMQPILTANGVSMQVAWDRRGEISLRYDDAESKWFPEQLLEFNAEQKELVPYTLAEDEELNSEVLTDLKNGLDELLLVDVERKPTGLSADLKAGEGFLNNQEAISSLVERGFAPISTSPDSEAEILSSEGEITCTLKDGVEYVLRFGNLKVGDGTVIEDSTPEDGDSVEDSDSGIHRYLFLMARFNESMIEKPVLDELPALPEENTEEKPAEETEDPSAEEANAEEATEEESSEEEPETEESETEEPESSDEAEASSKPAAEESEETSETEQAEEEANEAENSADQPKEEATAEEEPKDLETIIAERKSIEQENQRKLDEYQESIKTAQERVQELNERFGDWYYVISDDVYKKLHLDRQKLITKKKQEEETATTLPIGQ